MLFYLCPIAALFDDAVGIHFICQLHLVGSGSFPGNEVSY